MFKTWMLTEGHPSSRKSFPFELVVRYQNAGLQSFNADKVRTILFSLADLKIFPRKLIAFIFNVSVSVH